VVNCNINNSGKKEAGVIQYPGVLGGIRDDSKEDVEIRGG